MEEKYFCRNCKGLRNHKELFEKKKVGNDDDIIHWIEVYSVIECLGCETISFLKVYGDETMVRANELGLTEYLNDFEIFPYYLEKGREIDDWHLPSSISNIYIETIEAFKASALILTAGGLRAIIEAVCNHLKIKKGTLEERINLLHNKGFLTSSESKRIHSIRFIGNDALHEIEKPRIEHLHILLEIVNHLLANLFINDEIIKGRVDTIIDKYEDYLTLIENKITLELIGKEVTIKNLIGRSVRLINKENHLIFEKLFIEEIGNNKHDFISIIGGSPDMIYKIENLPPNDLPF